MNDVRIIRSLTLLVITDKDGNQIELYVTQDVLRELYNELGNYFQGHETK